MRPSTVLAVASSPGYQALCGHARASGVDQEALDDLLWLLNAHYDFMGHGQVLANVATLLAQPTFSPENLYWARHWPQLLDGIREVLAWANAERHVLADLQGLEAWNALPGGKRDNPLLGHHVDRHPLAAALWCAPNPAFDEMASRGYLWIQAQALAVHAEGKVRARQQRDEYFTYVGTREFAPNPGNASLIGRSIREVNSPEFARLLSNVPTQPKTPLFRNALHSLTIDFAEVDEPHRRAVQEQLALLKEYFLRVDDLLKHDAVAPRTRRAGPRLSIDAHHRDLLCPRVLVAGSALTTRSESLDEDTSIAVIERIPCREAEDDEEANERSGLAPFELRELVVRLYVYDELKKVMSALRLQRQAAEMRLQRLRFSSDELLRPQIDEIWATLRQSADSVRGAMNLSGRDMDHYRAGLLAHAMLTLGWDLARARSVKWHVLEDASPSTLRNLLLEPRSEPTIVVHQDKEGFQAVGILVPALSPEYLTELHPDLHRHARPAASALLLPDKTGLIEGLLSLSESDGRPASHGRTCFGVELKTAKRLLNDWLRGLNRRLRPDDATSKRELVSAAKLSHALEVECLHQCRDVVPGWLLSYHLERQQEARLYYSQYSIGRLLELYESCMLALAPTQPALQCNGSDRAFERTTLSLSIGARFVASADAVARLTLALQARIDRRLDLHSIGSIVDHHNHFTLYFCIAQGLLTSLRAVTAPTAILETRERLVDALPTPFGAYIAVVSDKSGGFNDRARAVPVTRLMDRLASNYQQHVSGVLQRLPIHGEWTEIRSSGRRAHAHQRLFRVSHDLSVHPVTPSWIEQEMAAMGIGLPANFARSFLRTELIERGTPPQSVDALLGHFDLGENPLGRYSTFDMSAHLQIVGDQIDKLAHEIGLRAIASQLVVPQSNDRTTLPAAGRRLLPVPIKRRAQHAKVVRPSLEREASELWKHVYEQATEHDKRQLSRLLHFLLTQPSPHAQVLCTPSRATKIGAMDEGSALSLEAAVLDRCQAGQLSRRDVESWLRLLHAGQRHLVRQGHAVHFTRLAYVAAERTSPFAADNDTMMVGWQCWTEALHRWILDAPDSLRSPLHAAAALALSAATHGMLHDRTALRRWLAAISSAGSRCVGRVADRWYFELELPSPLAGGSQRRRWFPDPLTLLLFLRTPQQPVQLTLSRLRQPLRELLTAAGTPKEWLPTGWAAILRAGRAKWSSREPPFLAEALARSYGTEALEPLTWHRIFEPDLFCQTVPGAVDPGSEGVTTVPEIESKTRAGVGAASGDAEIPEWESGHLAADIGVATEWVQCLREAMTPETKDGDMTVSVGLDRVASRFANDTAATAYIRWIGSLLGSEAQRASETAVAAPGANLTALGLRRTAVRLLPQLLLVSNGKWLGDLGAEERAAAFRELATYASETGQQDTLLPIVERLRTTLDPADIRPWHQNDDLDGDDIRRVDARLATIDELDEMLRLADLGIHRLIEPSRRPVVRVAILLAGKAGLRPTEWLGLRVADLTVSGGLCVWVRAYPERPLKSDNSERVVPLCHLLSEEECDEVQRWQMRRLRETSSMAEADAAKAPLLHLDEWPDAQTRAHSLIGEITRLIHHVTEDGALRAYSLRHTFASWTGLALCATSSSEISRVLDRHPSTIQWIRGGSKLRAALMGSDSTDRRGLYALSRLMGHLSPAVTLGHYSHLLDLLQLEAVHRHGGDVQAAVLVAASGLSRAHAYQLLSRAPSALVDSILDQATWSRDATHPVRPLVGDSRVVLGALNAHGAWLILQAYLRSGRSAEKIAEQFQIPEVALIAMATKAADLSVLMGEGCTKSASSDLAPSYCPPRGRLSQSKRAAGLELFEAVGELYKRDIALAEAGIRLHLQHWNTDHADVVLRDAKSASNYLDFLVGLGIPIEAITVVLRRVSNLDLDPPAWASDLMGRLSRPTIRVVKPQHPSKSQAAVQEPLGLKVTGPGGVGFGRWAIRTLFLAGVAQEARRN